MTVKQTCILNEWALSIGIGDGIERIDEDTQNAEGGRRILEYPYFNEGMVATIQKKFKWLSSAEGGKPVFRLNLAIGCSSWGFSTSNVDNWIEIQPATSLRGCSDKEMDA